MKHRFPPRTAHELWQVDRETALFGIAIRENAVVGQRPAEGIGNDHHDALGAVIWGFGDVAVEAMDFLDSAGWHAGVQGAGRAALPKSGHCDLLGVLIWELQLKSSTRLQMMSWS